MSDTENQLPIRIVLQLQEARIGDRNRLESIKESLSAGKELSETEKKYLEEKSAQLQMAIDHHTMVDWAMNFVRKLQEKEKKKNLTISELKNSLEKEKKAYKIDKKFLEQAPSRLKQEVEQQKKINETLDLISQLKQEKLGEDNKLDRISGLLRSRKPVDDIDRQYVTEKERALKKLVEYKTKVTRSIDATKKLQEADIKHSKKLDAIRHALEQKKPISSQETAYINARYEKLQRVLDEEHRIEWTKRAIEKLLQSGRGDAARFDSIMHLLEEEIPVPESEIKYLKEQYKVVLLIQHSTKKLEWVTGLIDNLRRNEIGDYQRLSYIKKAIEERKPLPGNEITYLKDKYKTLDIITKNSQNEDHKDTNEKEEIDYNSVLDGLNDAITQLQVLQAKN